MKVPGRNAPCSCGSGRKFKHCCAGSGAFAASPVGPSASHSAHKGGLEPLTEELISELVEKGMPEGDLRFAARSGATYNRQRNSLIMPTELEL